MSNVESVLLHYAKSRGYSSDSSLKMLSKGSDSRPNFVDLAPVCTDFDALKSDLSQLLAAGPALLGHQLDSVIQAVVVRAVSEHNHGLLDGLDAMLSEVQAKSVKEQLGRDPKTPAPLVELTTDCFVQLERYLADELRSPLLYQLVRDSVCQESAPQSSSTAEPDFPSFCRFYRITPAQGRVISCSVSPDGNYLAAGTDQSTLVISKLRPEAPDLNRAGQRTNFHLDFPGGSKTPPEPGPEQTTVRAHSAPIYDVKFVPDSHKSRYVLSCSGDRTVRLFDTSLSCTNLAVYSGHDGPIWSLDVSPKGQFFATGCLDNCARLFTPERLNPLRVFVAHTDSLDCVAFHPNSKVLATGSADNSVRVFSLESGQCVRMFDGFRGGVEALAFSPNGEFLCAATGDRALYVWELGSGKLFSTVKANWHEDQVCTMLVTPKWMLSADAGGLVRLSEGLPGAQGSLQRVDTPQRAAVMGARYLEGQQTLVCAGALL